MTAFASQNSRTDARHNRARVMGVARTTLAAQGLDVTMREIARRAGLGVSTLYRHFPTRDDLIAAVFAEQVATCSATVVGAAANPNPWQGITDIVDAICGRHELAPGFDALMLRSDERRFEKQRTANIGALTRLVHRAHQERKLRSDLTIADVQLALRAVIAVPASSRAQAPLEVRRLAATLLRGMSAEPSSLRKPSTK